MCLILDNLKSCTFFTLHYDIFCTWIYTYNNFKEIQLTQQLQPAEHLERTTHVVCALEKQVVNGDLSDKIFFNDEEHFSHKKYVQSKIVPFVALKTIK